MKSLNRRVRGDLIALYRGVTGIEKMEKDIFEIDAGTTRTHTNKLKTRCVRDIKKKVQFPLLVH